MTGGSYFPLNRDSSSPKFVTDEFCFPLNRVQQVQICDGWILFSVKKGSASPNL